VGFFRFSFVNAVHTPHAGRTDAPKSQILPTLDAFGRILRFFFTKIETRWYNK